MKADFIARWAENPSTLRREPTPAEVAGGFPCGPLDLPLWNELTFRLTQIYGEAAYVITSSGQTPNANNLTQLWTAIQKVGSDGAEDYITSISITGGRTKTYSTPGAFTWTVPTDVTSIRVLDCIGSGGGGGGASGVTAAGSAGGGGGNARDGVYTVTPGEVLSIVVGAPGAAGIGGSSPTNGGTGGTSFITRQDGTVLCSASGGGGGFAGNGIVQSTSRGVGGAAVGGARNYSGAGGGFPIAIMSTLILGGIGGPAGSAAGQPQLNASNAGLDGFPRGGGANGSSANAPGGTGGVGEVTFSY